MAVAVAVLGISVGGAGVWVGTGVSVAAGDVRDEITVGVEVGKPGAEPPAGTCRQAASKRLKITRQRKARMASLLSCREG